MEISVSEGNGAIRYINDRVLIPQRWNGTFSTPEKIRGFRISHVTNIKTGKGHKNSHHCTRPPGHVSKKSCFDKEHMVWCAVIRANGLPCGERAPGNDKICSDCTENGRDLSLYQELLDMGPIKLPYGKEEHQAELEARQRAARAAALNENLDHEGEENVDAEQIDGAADIPERESQYREKKPKMGKKEKKEIKRREMIERTAQTNTQLGRSRYTGTRIN